MGKRAHVARPWAGVNAIHQCAPLLQALADDKPRPIKRGNVEFFEVRAATFGNGGIAVNVIPDKFELTVNIRFAPGKSAEQSMQEFKELVATKFESSAAYKLDFTNIHPSGDVPQENDLLEDFRSRYKLREVAQQAYTDVGLLGTHGISAVNFGPGITTQAHQAGEHVRIADLLKCFEIYRDFISVPRA
ncbi:MAG: peptidase dimerization domain-containing protein [Oligoflexia bacterium]|nr:peptidase dimerization domain-containing protein [Oligoflexia bacterium]